MSHILTTILPSQLARYVLSRYRPEWPDGAMRQFEAVAHTVILEKGMGNGREVACHILSHGFTGKHLASSIRRRQGWNVDPEPLESWILGNHFDLWACHTVESWFQFISPDILL